MKTYLKICFLSALGVSIFSGYASAALASSPLNLQAKVEAEVKEAKLEAIEDFDKALADAKKEGKVLMLEFTGSDWCPPCMMLHKLVLNTDEFAKYAKEKVKLVVADFDRSGRPKNAKQAKQYSDLADKYQLRGFPTIVLIDPSSGNTETMIGLETRTPSELVEKIEKFSKAQKK